MKNPIAILGLSGEHVSAQEGFRKFVDSEVVPQVIECERTEQLPQELIMRVAQAGYFGALLPEEVGGSGMDMLSYGLLNEELGRVSSSVRGLVMLQNMVAYTLFKWGSETQKKYWLSQIASGKIIAALALTEPNVGSDIKNVETNLTKSGDNYLLNGHKIWITLGQIADLFLVLCRLEGKLSAVLLERDTPGFSITPIKRMSGLKATMLAELKFKDCHIPKENIVGKLGFGLAPVAFLALDIGRYSIAWGCVGLAQGCLDANIEFTRTRRQFGTFIKDHQLIQSMVTEMIANIKAARLLCIQAGHLREMGHPTATVETMVAKYFASTMATQVAINSVQIHGAIGCQEDHLVQRHLRDAKLMEIIEGTTQIHQIKIAEYNY